MVPLVKGAFRAAEHVLAIVVVAVIAPKGIAITLGIEWTVSPHDDDSALCLGIHARKQRDDPREKQSCQNEAA